MLNLTLNSTSNSAGNHSGANRAARATVLSARAVEGQRGQMEQRQTS